MARSETLERRKDGLGNASSPHGVAHAREGGWSTDSRYHLRENVSRADEELAAQIADAPAPFWRIVREAIKTEQAM
jgi:hypothetical protein